MKTWMRFVFAAIAVLAVLFSSLPGVAQDSIKIGMLTPLSGPATAFGLASKLGMQLAVDDVNAKGGINGKKLEVIVYDSQSKPAVSATLVQRLIIEDKVALVCVGTGSIDALAMMEVTERAKVPLVVFASASPTVTERGNKWVWRIALNDKLTAEFMARYINTKNWSRIAILYENSDYGRPPSEILERLVKAQPGKQVVAMETYNRGDSDISGQLMKIKKTNPDLLVTWGYYTEGAQIARQKQQIGLKVQMMGNSVMIFPEFIQLGGAAVESAMFMTTVHSYINPDPSIQAFDKRYQEKFGRPLGLVSIDNYNGIVIVAEALRKVGTDPQKLQNAFNTMTFPGIVGPHPMKFDATGQRIVRNVIVAKIEGGKHKFVELFPSK